MNYTLYELVKESKKNKYAMEELINLFEPKLKKSLSLTHYENREDLSQELKFKLVNYIQNYDLEEIPGFWEIKEQIESKILM